MKNKIGFVGFGRMGSALGLGAVQAKAVSANHLYFYDPVQKLNKEIKRSQVKRVGSLDDLIKNADLIFLCVKPQQMAEVLRKIKESLKINGKRKPHFVSIAAGVPLNGIKKAIGSSYPLSRVMPNTPALYGAGMSAVTFGKGFSGRYKKVVRFMLLSVGACEEVKESQMDAVTALSGSGPAYVFLLAEAMLKASRKLGVPKNIGEKLVRQTIFGSGNMLLKSSLSAELLRQNVTSKGGTTEAAMNYLTKNLWAKKLGVAIDQAAKRSRDLSLLLRDKLK